MKYFILPRGRILRAPLRELNIRFGRLALKRFPDGERFVMLGSAVAGEHCALLGSLTSDPADLIATTVAASALKKEGAASVTLVAPFLAYLRQDRAEERKSLGARWLGALLAASGIDGVTAVDMHSERATGMLGLPFTSLDPSALFAEALGSLPAETVFVAPDNGALPRARRLAERSGIPTSVGWFEKKRTPSGIALGGYSGPIATAAVLTDDILDTGATLINTADRLRELGFRDVRVVITHGLFTGTAWRALWDAGVRHIWTTDSIMLPARARDERITVVRLAPLIAEYLLSRP